MKVYRKEVRGLLECLVRIYQKSNTVYVRSYKYVSTH